MTSSPGLRWRSRLQSRRGVLQTPESKTILAPYTKRRWASDNWQWIVDDVEKMYYFCHIMTPNTTVRLCEIRTDGEQHSELKTDTRDFQLLGAEMKCASLDSENFTAKHMT